MTPWSFAVPERARLMVACPDCAFENLSDASFCANCGRALTRPVAPVMMASAQPAREAERRFVTVLFADLSGFTNLTETRDPEEVRELVNACFDRLVPIVENHQGVVDQFVGDAIVALFGAPLAHEDDPARACRTALEMMQAIEEMNNKHQVELGLHVGVNSGMVLAGGIGSRGRQQYSVLGDAVNMASRLQDTAERGEIFVGLETYKLVREQFEFVSRGKMPFKGKSELQEVWQLTQAKRHTPAHRRVSTTSPLLGRARELALLKRVTRELGSDGQGLRIVSIPGDAGLGKTRLVQEWRDAVLGAPAPPQFLIAACAPDSAGRAFALIAEMARALVPAPSDSRRASAALKGLLGSGETALAIEQMDGVAVQAQYANALKDLIAERAANEALVIVCEDLHWADEPSVRVLERALGQLLDTRVLIGFTARPEPEAPGWVFLETIQELPGIAALRLHLTPLAEQDANALLASLLPGAILPEVRRLILEHAEGNPLFVEELVRMLLDRRDLKRAGDRWEFARERVELDVPNTLQGVLMERIDQLPVESRRILQLASVLGREFPVEVLEEMLTQLERASR